VSIYDRDYFRPQQPSAFSKLPHTVVGMVILVNVVVFVADLLTPEFLGGPLSDHFATHVYTLRCPWLWWQFLTAGFTHSPTDFWHILGNMFVLFIFGRDIEYRYGSKEFLRFYLTTLIVANVA